MKHAWMQSLRELISRVRAWQGWRDVDAPYELARARVLLARAYRAEGDDDAARVELESAQSAFDRIGAARESTRISALLARPADARAVRTFMFTDIVRSTNLLGYGSTWCRAVSTLTRHLLGLRRPP